MKRIDVQGNGSSYTTADPANRFESAKYFVENTLISIIEQFDNVSYVGMYESGTTAKYMFDIMYDSYYLALYVIGYSIRFGVCKNTDTETIGYVYQESNGYSPTENSWTDSEGTKQYKTVYDTYLYVITKNGNNLFTMFTFDKTNSASVVLDEDNYGVKYLVCFKGLIILRDDGLYLKSNSNFNTLTPNNNIEDTVWIENVYVLQSNEIKGVLKHTKRILSTAVSNNGAYKLIEADGIRYRQLYSYLWVVESE